MNPAVLFDLGDVLVHLRFERGLARFVELAGGDLKLAPDAAALFVGTRAIAWNAGQLEQDEFFRWLADALSAPQVTPEEMRLAWCDIFDPWPEMERLADEVIALGHESYVCSNTDPLHWGLLKKQMPVLGRMSGTFLSFEERICKPEPAYFERALKKFDLEPSEAVFIDDREANVEAARELGIASLLHRGDVDEVRVFLRTSGIAVKPPDTGPVTPW